jgi:hypothetical protein
MGLRWKGEMMFTLTIKTGNAAFEDNEASEITRILREIANDIESRTRFIGRGDTTLTGTCRDINGNTVGKWELK